MRDDAIDDGHIHLTSREPGSRGSAADLLADMDAAGVRRAAVVTPSTMGWDNSVTFDAVAAHPDRLVAIVRVDPEGPNAVAELEDALDRGAAGIRLTLLGATTRLLEGETADALAAALTGRRAVAELHCAPEQLVDVGRYAARHPRLPVVVDHLGRPVPGSEGGRGQRDFLALAELPNVAAKTPSLGFFSREPFPHRDIAPFLTAALDRFGARRVLWGSDWPGSDEFGPYARALDGVLAALEGRPGQDRAAVLGGTFQRLLVDRAGVAP